MNEFFRKFASRASELLGTPWAFIIAAASILMWGISGPIFGFSDTWQLLANTGTTLITFLMVFLIQNTQNRDAKAIHLKLDELLRGVQGARTSMVDLEDLSDEELKHLQAQFQELHERLNETAGDVRQAHEAAAQKVNEVRETGEEEVEEVQKEGKRQVHRVRDEGEHELQQETGTTDTTPRQPTRSA